MHRRSYPTRPPPPPHAHTHLAGAAVAYRLLQPLHARPLRQALRVRARCLDARARACVLIDARAA